jgi:hypothetical protein
MHYSSLSSSCVLGLTCLLGAVAANTSAQSFTQDRFAIGFWVDPPMDERADERYAEIAAAHFTVVIGGFGAATPETVIRQLELCEKYGLKAIVAQAGLEPRDLPDGPACWGYKVRDEPSAAQFAELQAINAGIYAERPGKLAYINLFPSYASPWGQLGAPNYDEYVRLFCEEVDTVVLSMDHYPIFKPDADGRDGYCGDLAVMRKYSLEYDKPFWNFFNVMPYGPHTDPTEAQLRWQIHSSLAYGAKGVLYFCYYTPGPGGEFPKGGAIIGRDDRPTHHYDQARRINRMLVNWGPTLMQLTSTDVIRVASGDEVAAELEGSPLRNIVHAPVDPPHDYLIGVFRHSDGRRAVMVNNYRFAYSAWPTLEFDVPTDAVREIDPETGEEIPVIDNSPDLPGFQASLDAGSGRLFLCPAIDE